MKKLVFFDLETGGLNWWPEKMGRTYVRAPIIQIAAIAVDCEDGFKPVDSMEIKLRFSVAEANAEALRVNGYTPERWADAIEPGLGLNGFRNFLKKHATSEQMSLAGRPYKVAELAGHNIAQFDIQFLRAWFKETNEFLPAAWHHLDTMTLAVALAKAGRIDTPANYKLGTLCEMFGIVHEHAHDALGDVKATAELARRLIGRIGGEMP